MLKVIEAPVQNWTQNEAGKRVTGGGYELNDNVLKRMCQWNKVPTDLLNVDAKHHTDITKQVLGLTFGDKAPSLVVDGETNKVLSYVNPKSQWIPDEVFIDMDLNRMLLDSGHEFEEEDKAYGAGRKKTFTFLSKDDDPNYTFMGDVFKKQLIVERLDEGGLLVTFGILRLVCTNGSTANEKMFRKIFHQIRLGDDALRTYIPQFAAQIADLSLSHHLHDLWTDRQGNMLKASVQDYMGMRNTLKAITDEENAELLFPMDPIYNHYDAQGIDIKKLTYSQRDMIPSGVNYYDSFNFLTHGIKAKDGELDLGEKIKVAAWSRPSRLNKIKNSSIDYKGEPFFSEAQIHFQSGDRIA